MFSFLDFGQSIECLYLHAIIFFDLYITELIYTYFEAHANKNQKFFIFEKARISIKVKIKRFYLRLYQKLKKNREIKNVSSSRRLNK